MNQKGFSPILIILGIVVILGIVSGAYYLGQTGFKQSIPTPQPSLNPAVSSQPSPNTSNCNSDHDCSLYVNGSDIDVTGFCCSIDNCVDYSSDTVVAVNKSWLSNHRAAVCGSGIRNCPNIRLQCSNQVSESRNRYTAACVNNQCQKVPQPAQDETTNWKIYIIKTLGLEFKLPLSLSNLVQLDEKVTNGTTGTMVRVYFRGVNLAPSNESEVIGADSKDFSAGRSALFTDLLGYSTSDGKYYVRFASNPSSSPVLIPDIYHPLEITNPNGVRILTINNPHPNTYGDDGFIFIPTDLGALIHTNNTVYPAIIFQANTGINMNEHIFNQILSTFKFTN